MILYHFTRPNYVESIQEHGIIRGDVPTTPAGGFNAPWLTDDPEPKHQSWVAITEKNKVRITVNIKREINLRKWNTYAKAIQMDETWYKALDAVGGGGSDHWYIYLGRIPANWITNIEYL